MALASPVQRAGRQLCEAARPFKSQSEQAVAEASQALLSVSTERISENRAVAKHARRDLRVRQEAVGNAGVTKNQASTRGRRGDRRRRRDRQMGGASYD